MFPVEMLTGTIRDEELATIRSLALVSHTDHPPHVVTQWSVEFIFEVFTPAARPSSAGTCRVATLQHEVSDITVEDDIFVVSFLRQLDEVPYGFGRKFGEEFEIERAVGCGDACVAGGLDAPWLEHVFFVGEEGEVAGRVGG